MTVYRDRDVPCNLWPFPFRVSVALFLIAVAAVVTLAAIYLP